MLALEKDRCLRDKKHRNVGRKPDARNIGYTGDGAHPQQHCGRDRSDGSAHLPAQRSHGSVRLHRHLRARRAALGACPRHLRARTAVDRGVRQYRKRRVRRHVAIALQSTPSVHSDVDLRHVRLNPETVRSASSRRWASRIAAELPLTTNRRKSNLANGTISGESGVRESRLYEAGGAAATVTNAGSITGTTATTVSSTEIFGDGLNSGPVVKSPTMPAGTSPARVTASTSRRCRGVADDVGGALLALRTLG
jgi:hypothetical protein